MQVELLDCGHCGVHPGEFHLIGCDAETCMRCGGQAISCPCLYEVNGIDCEETENGEITEEQWVKMEEAITSLGGREIWAGASPGHFAAVENGFYSRWLDKERRFEKCGPEEDGAYPDLNRINPFGGFNWCAKRRAWFRPESEKVKPK